MEIKIEASGPQGCGKSRTIDEIELVLIERFGRCAVQSKDWGNDDNTVTFTIDTSSRK